ncbi:MAG: phosphatidate cytidylyltransferase [Planctomycetota bacterium]|nr:phosphatidate cytidylyltransferase [Planctomycetota bacterium]
MGPIPALIKHRIITGAILIVGLLAIVWFDDWLEGVELWGGTITLPPGLVLLALTALILPLAALELTSIFASIHERTFSTTDLRTRRIIMCGAALFGLFLSYIIHVYPADFSASESAAMLVFCLLGVYVTSLFSSGRAKEMKEIVNSAIATVFSFGYLGLLLGMLLALRHDHSAWWLVGIVFITKSADIGAYFTGKAIDKHKLIPWLSPGKTWEGLGGGLVFACLVGMGFAMLSRSLENPSDHAPIWFGLVCGASFTFAGLLGDLHMSLLKRSAGLKDSSTILPGLGGVLDVLDSLLFVAPVAYWLVRLLP